MAKHLINDENFDFVEGTEKSDFEALTARVDEIVAGNTTNATGYDVVTLSETVNQGENLRIFYRFDTPQNATIIEAAYRDATTPGSMWLTENLKVYQTSTYVQLQVDNYTASGTAEFKLVYTVPKPIELDELTDIRVGYDGVVYGSAGEAVRRQVGNLAVANSGFDNQVKAALMNLLNHVSFTDENRQQYLDELENAMYHTLPVMYISAVFDQGQNEIYESDSLDSLKQYLTVTAHYEDGTSGEVLSYTLSGTLTVGTSPITVTYGGKSDTFDVTVSTFPIVPWATGTDEQIAAMIAAMDAGNLSIQDTGWQIGDERVVQLAAMEAATGGEAHAAQSVTLVLMDSQHYDLTDGGKDHFVVGFKECLAEGGQLSYSSTWGVTLRRTWCNTVFRNAIPETLRNCFKQFKCISANETGDTLSTTDDYFALFAEKEIIGSRNKASQIEANALTQIQWYATPANRIKDVSGFQHHEWWLRSHENRSWYFVTINANGASTTKSYEYKLGLAPFGCI